MFEKQKKTQQGRNPATSVAITIWFYSNLAFVFDGTRQKSIFISNVEILMKFWNEPNEKNPFFLHSFELSSWIWLCHRSEENFVTGSTKFVPAFSCFPQNIVI